jgi:hypothetical protein
LYRVPVAIAPLYSFRRQDMRLPPLLLRAAQPRAYAFFPAASFALRRHTTHHKLRPTAASGSSAMAANRQESEGGVRSSAVPQKQNKNMVPFCNAG